MNVKEKNAKQHKISTKMDKALNHRDIMLNIYQKEKHKTIFREENNSK